MRLLNETKTLGCCQEVTECCFECEEVGVVRPVRPVLLNYPGDVLSGMDCQTPSEANSCAMGCEASLIPWFGLMLQEAFTIEMKKRIAS